MTERILSERQYRYERNAEQARILAEALVGHPIGESYHDTLTPKTERPKRSHRHLLVALLLERDGDQCYLCRKTLEPHRTQVDHIIPLAHGGEDEPWNVALACDQCNSRKNSAFVSLRIPSGQPVYHLV